MTPPIMRFVTRYNIILLQNGGWGGIRLENRPRFLYILINVCTNEQYKPEPLVIITIIVRLTTSPAPLWNNYNATKTQIESIKCTVFQSHVYNNGFITVFFFWFYIGHLAVPTIQGKSSLRFYERLRKLRNNPYTLYCCDYFYQREINDKKNKYLMSLS